jgi:cytochrome P450
MTDISTVAAESATADVPRFPMPRAAGCPFDPPPALQTLQQEAPITSVRLWDDSTAWLITRYDDIRALLADPRISADSSHPHYPHRSPGEQARRRMGRTFVTMDDPEHARLRRMVTSVFAIKRVEALRPLVQRIVDGLIDAMLTGPTPVDLVGAFALPVPSLVICHLLGVPYADHDFFQANTRNIMKYGAAPEESAATQRKMIDYLENLVAQKLTTPGDDLLSTVADQVREGRLSRRDAAVLGNTMLVAGHETTANMIALGTLALLRHPDQHARLRDSGDPKLIAAAVEELLRYLTIVHGGRRRVALADIQIGGQTIHAGDRVVVATDIGNRDPSVFAEPARLDIGRDARHHVAFGYGSHQCLGQPLARMELQVVYGTLYRRIPTLRLAADLDHVPFKHDGLVYGVYELPVTW